MGLLLGKDRNNTGRAFGVVFWCKRNVFPVLPMRPTSSPVTSWIVVSSALIAVGTLVAVSVRDDPRTISLEWIARMESAVE
jgi:hypothetical protein